MEPTARLFQCSFCQGQAMVCSNCDRGQIYCSDPCSAEARRRSLLAAGKRYQATIKGKRNHAARQARYEMKLKFNLTHHSSLQAPPCDSMKQLENNTENTETKHRQITLTCNFCKKTVSVWLRNDFLQGRNRKKTLQSPEYPQAP